MNVHIPSREDLLAEIEKMQQRLKDFPNARSVFHNVTPRVGIKRQVPEDQVDYYLQIALAAEGYGPCCVNFGSPSFPTFQYEEFHFRVVDEYHEHIDHEQDMLCVYNLQPEEAADLVIKILTDYQEFINTEISQA